MPLHPCRHIDGQDIRYPPVDGQRRVVILVVQQMLSVIAVGDGCIVADHRATFLCQGWWCQSVTLQLAQEVAQVRREVIDLHLRTHSLSVYMVGP